MKSNRLFFAALACSIMAMSESAFGMTSVERFKPIEIRVPHSEQGVKNIWDDVTLSGIFRSPDGDAFSVNGFYHSKDLWMVRFAPHKSGVWKYQLSISDKNGQSEIVDSFECVASNEQGFIRLHPQDSKRWIYSGSGNLYTALGFGDCMGVQRDSIFSDGDLLDGGYRPPGFHEGISWILPYSQYLISYGDVAGFNIYRYSDANCAYSIIKNISTSGNDYDTLHSRWTDTLFTTLRAHGFRVYMTILESPVGKSSDNNSMAATLRYAQYCIDRYGSLVDFWELTNESNPDSLWISTVANYIHTHDPYRHLVSMSNETPNHPAIDIISPHWYGKEDVRNSDQTTADRIDTYRSIAKPVIFGEQGESRWDSLSPMRLRGRIWSALFNEGTLIFWNSTFAKDCACNQYLGWIERHYVRALQNFSVLLDSGVRPSAPTKIGGMLNVWALRSAKVEALYLRNDQDVFATDNLPYVPVDIPADGQAIWYDVHSGAILQQQPVTAGAHTLLPPAFQTDIAFIGGDIRQATLDSERQIGDRFEIDVNPRTEELLNVPIRTPETFDLQITNIGTDTITLIKNWISSPSNILSLSIATPFPIVLRPGQQITLTVDYSLSDTGGTAAMLSFLQSGSPSWENVAISATGAPSSGVRADEISGKEVHIFPDPSGDQLTVELPDYAQSEVTVRILSATGVRVDEQPAGTKNRLTFDTSKLPDGLYQLIVVQNNDVIGSKKLIVKH